jgi:hypothetical protein
MDKENKTASPRIALVIASEAKRSNLWLRSNHIIRRRSRFIARSAFI